MDYFKGTKTQISPCIAAKARFTLNLTEIEPNNTKKCSYDYWCKVIETFAYLINLKDKTVKEAKNKYKSLNK